MSIEVLSLKFESLYFEFQNACEGIEREISKKLQSIPDYFAHLENTLEQDRLDMERRCEHAASLLSEMAQCVTDAATEGYELGDLSTQRRELQRLRLAVDLGWAVNKGNDQSLRKAIELAQSSEYESDGLIRSVLLPQALERQNQIREGGIVIGSLEQRTQQIEQLLSQLSKADEKEIPLEDLQDFKDLLKKVLDLNQKFSLAGIKQIQDEAQAGNIYRSLKPYVEQHREIQKIAEDIISQFLDKASQYVEHDPLTAQYYFTVVNRFKEFIDPNNSVLIFNIQELQSQINKNCENWKKVDDLLEEINTLLSKINTYEECWAVFEKLGEAIEVYPKHTRIEGVKEICVRKAGDQLLREIAAHKEAIEENFQQSERKLVNTFWSNHFLENPQSLPNWLVEAQETAKKLSEEVNVFGKYVSKYLKEQVENQQKLIQDYSTRFTERLEKLDQFIREFIEKRQIIRRMVTNVQEIIQQSDDETRIERATTVYRKFLDTYPDYQNDPEVLEIAELIRAHSSDTDLLKNACLSYKKGQWEECIRYCQKVTQIEMKESLSEEVDEGFVNKHLRLGIEKKLDLDATREFAGILMVLAKVHRLSEQISQAVEKKFYDELEELLRNFNRYARSSSPYLEDIKDKISFETYYQDFLERKRWGEREIIQGQKLNRLVKQLFYNDYPRLQETIKPDVEWLKQAKEFLDTLMEIGEQSESLWVGKLALMKHDIGEKYCEQLNEHLKRLNSRLQEVPKEIIQQAYEFLQTAKHSDFYIKIKNEARYQMVYRLITIKEQENPENYRDIINYWRNAVREFPTDSKVFEQFNKKCWEGWLFEIDKSLREIAKEYDPSIEERMNKLFDKDFEEFPFLFAPIEIPGTYPLHPKLQEYHEEIKLRKESWEIIRRAEKEVRKDPSQLPMILNLLRQQYKRLNRQEIDLKIKALSEEFIRIELRTGDDCMARNDPLRAVEHYIRARSLGEWQGWEDWLKQNRNYVQEYWRRLKDEIKQLNSFERLVEERYSEIQELQIRLDEVKKCELHIIASSNEIKELEDSLTKEERKWREAKDIFRKFRPDDDAWKKAFNPPGFENTRLMKDSVLILGNYFQALGNYISSQHYQVDALGKFFNVFKSAIESLCNSVDLLRLNLEETEDYRSCLQSCSQIVDAVNILCTNEENYFESWRSWTREEIKLQRYYATPEDVYERLPEFPYKRSRKFSYYVEGKEFEEWLEWQQHYIERKSKQQGIEYNLNEENTKIYLVQHRDEINNLRQSILDKNNETSCSNIPLGSFLLVAYDEKLRWEARKKDFDNKKKIYLNFYDWLRDREPSAFLYLTTLQIIKKLEEWIEKTLREYVNEGNLVVETAQKYRQELVLAIRVGKDYVADGELQRLLKELQQKYDEMQNEEKRLLEKYDRLQKSINLGLLDGDTEETLEKLQSFYDDEESDEIWDELETIDVHKDQINELYRAYERYKRFFNYVRECVKG